MATGDARRLPVPIAAAVLIIVEEATAAEVARAIREAKEEVALSIVTHQLRRRLGQDIPSEIAQQLAQLPLASITDLSDALFDFATLADLQTWLSSHPSV
jgi:hypothetical protein